MLLDVVICKTVIATILVVDGELFGMAKVKTSPRRAPPPTTGFPEASTTLETSPGKLSSGNHSSPPEHRHQRYYVVLL